MWNQPSTSDSAVASGLLWYPRNTCGPAIEISPSSSMRIDVPGNGGPTVPILTDWGRLTAVAEVDSVSP